MDESEAEGPCSEPMEMGERMRRRVIDHKRRLQLQHFANKIAADVMENTKPHERCLLRRMVENLLPGED